MIFTGIGLWAASALAVGSAAALALLHLLRVRPREVRVVTTLFWAHAAERTRARTLLERFRHPVTYALLLAFCLLLVLALARPERTKESADRVYEVVVVDAGVSMGARDRAAGGSRFEAARNAALARANRLSSDDRLAVIVADPQPRLIHPFEDPHALLRKQLAGITPAPLPAANSDALELAASLLEGKQNPRVVWVTDRAVEGGVPRGLKPAAQEFNLQMVCVGRAADNAAILSAMFEPDVDNPLRGRFCVRVGYWGKQPRDITVQVDRGGGAPLLSETRTIEPGGTADFIVADLPADGDELVVQLGPGDAVGADDRAVFRVPLRTPIRIGGDSIPQVLRIAMQADPAVQLVGDAGDRDIDVIAGPARAVADRPAVVVWGDGLVGPARGRAGSPVGEPVAVVGGSRLLRGLDFEGAACGTGRSLGELDGDAELLLVVGDAVVAAVSKGAGPAQVHLSAALLAADSDVCQRPAFAILVTRALRSLVGWDDDPVVLAPERAVEDPLWAQREYEGGLVVIMPGSRSVADLSYAGVAEDKATPTASGRLAMPALFEIVLILALALFLVEAALHARGRIS